jgi:hypothetical protein
LTREPISRAASRGPESSRCSRQGSSNSGMAGDGSSQVSPTSGNDRLRRRRHPRSVGILLLLRPGEDGDNPAARVKPAVPVPHTGPARRRGCRVTGEDVAEAASGSGSSFPTSGSVTSHRSEPSRRSRAAATSAHRTSRNCSGHGPSAGWSTRCEITRTWLHIASLGAGYVLVDGSY